MMGTAQLPIKTDIFFTKIITTAYFIWRVCCSILCLCVYYLFWCVYWAQSTNVFFVACKLPLLTHFEAKCSYRSFKETFGIYFPQKQHFNRSELSLLSRSEFYKFELHCHLKQQTSSSSILPYFAPQSKPLRSIFTVKCLKPLPRTWKLCRFH